MPQELLNTVREWTKKQSSQMLTVSTSETPYEFVVAIQPLNERASPVEFRIAKYNAYITIAAGKGIQFDNVPPSKELLLDICEAVQDGRIIEWTWVCNGHLVKSKGIIQLTKTQWHSNRTNVWRLMHCISGFF